MVKGLVGVDCLRSGEGRSCIRVMVLNKPFEAKE